MSSLIEQLRIIDDTYLTGISNMGIVNMAQKDLDASGIRVALSDGMLEASFADGTSVVITGTLSNFKCSCPSRTICKHVVMSLLSASQQVGAQSGKNDSNPCQVAEPSGNEDTNPPQMAEQSGNEDDNPCQVAAHSGKFEYLLGYKQDTLIVAYGKSVYNDVLFKVMSGETCEIEESTVLILKIMDGAFTVRFLP